MVDMSGVGLVFGIIGARSVRARLDVAVDEHEYAHGVGNLGMCGSTSRRIDALTSQLREFLLSNTELDTRCLT